MRKCEVVTGVELNRVGAHGTRQIRLFVVPASEADAPRPADAKPPSAFALASVASD